MTDHPGIAEGLGFWFVPERRTDWFEVSEAFDAKVRQGLGSWHEAATSGRLEGWRESAQGCLALCILLDQAPRNIFRGSARAFATDPQALAVARHAIERGFDLAIEDQDRRLFLYLPLEHSEDLADQDLCVALCRERIDDSEYLRYAERHREIVARFGRFPHRNAILGRASTPEEEAFLAEPFSSF